MLRSNENPKIMLSIGGAGAESYLAEMQALVNRLKLSDHVEFLGFLNVERKLEAMAEADVFVLPSLHENFSLSTAEALASGLPVIVSDRVGIAEEIRVAKAGIVVPANSPVLLADAIMKLVDPDERQLTGKNARTLAQERFSRTLFGRALLRLYDEILKIDRERARALENKK
jgi:glycosyltransferase involved in cell wall biosynthesis